MIQEEGALTLTPRQLEVLEFIARSVKEQGVSPTMLEIGRFLGVHKTTAREHVYKLVDRGALGSRNWGMPRSLFLTEAALGLISARPA